MAPRAEHPAGWRRSACGDRLLPQPSTILLFLVAGFHVFPELVPRRIFHGAGASLVRCKLDSADSPFLRTHFLPGAGAGAVVHPNLIKRARGRTGHDHLQVDDRKSASGPRVACQVAAVHQAGVRRRGAILLWCVVALLGATSVLVIETGRHGGR